MTILNYDGSASGLKEASSPCEYVFQMTLAQSIKLSGKGLHSGRDVSVEIYPAPEDTGIVFVNGAHSIPALASNVVDTSRGTTIGFNGSSVRTIEHLMAALRGRGVDNAIVKVSGPETPALDGSARPYIEAIDTVGLITQEIQRKPLVITRPICVKGRDSFILAVPAPQFCVTYTLNYKHPMIGSQSTTYVLNEDNFGEELAPARTFVLYEEVAGLYEKELARGGSVDNVIVIWQDKMSSELRFPDELVRHKLVDMVGDLALAGGLIQAEILAVKSGHSLNVAFAREVQRVLSETSDGVCAEPIPA